MSNIHPISPLRSIALGLLTISLLANEACADAGWICASPLAQRESPATRPQAQEPVGPARKPAERVPTQKQEGAAPSVQPQEARPTAQEPKPPIAKPKELQDQRPKAPSVAQPPAVPPRRPPALQDQHPAVPAGRTPHTPASAEPAVAAPSAKPASGSPGSNGGKVQSGDPGDNPGPKPKPHALPTAGPAVGSPAVPGEAGSAGGDEFGGKPLPSLPTTSLPRQDGRRIRIDGETPLDHGSAASAAIDRWIDEKFGGLVQPSTGTDTGAPASGRRRPGTQPGAGQSPWKDPTVAEDPPELPDEFETWQRPRARTVDEASPGGGAAGKAGAGDLPQPLETRDPQRIRRVAGGRSERPAQEPPELSDQHPAGLQDQRPKGLSDQHPNGLSDQRNEIEGLQDQMKSQCVAVLFLQDQLPSNPREAQSVLARELTLQRRRVERIRLAMHAAVGDEQHGAADKLGALLLDEARLRRKLLQLHARVSAPAQEAGR